MIDISIKTVFDTFAPKKIVENQSYQSPIYQSQLHHLDCTNGGNPRAISISLPESVLIDSRSRLLLGPNTVSTHEGAIMLCGSDIVNNSISNFLYGLDTFSNNSISIWLSGPEII